MSFTCMVLGCIYDSEPIHISDNLKRYHVCLSVHIEAVVVMIVGYITTYAISAYHHLHYEFESRSCELYLRQHYI